MLRAPQNTLPLPLREIARLYGVQTAYYDVAGLRRRAPREALLKVLAALGAPLESLRDVPVALQERRRAVWTRLSEPVAVAWESSRAKVEIRLPAVAADGPLFCHLRLEDGDEHRWVQDLSSLAPSRSEEVEGVTYVAKQIALPSQLPWGYHSLFLERAGRRNEVLVIAAPLRAYEPLAERADVRWGVFLPLYALHSQQSWGAGSFSDLADLAHWVATLGGSVVATLPLLPAFLDQPFDPSPYAPVSRLFWNEFYVDVTGAPELVHCPQAQALLGSKEVQGEIAELRASPLVDYRRQMALKRKVLEELARCAFTAALEGGSALSEFSAANPAVEDYARFRAAGEHWGAPWPRWPQSARDGVLRPGDHSEESRRYHVYAQWLAHRQMAWLAKGTQAQGRSLYLDLPLGVHADGYDVWRERGSFALGASVGAPPDGFFITGQDWGFPPLHPEGNRNQRYRYVIAFLRHHLRRAELLRIDHVMGLHRLYWIPEGFDAQEGVYVRYPAEELYAILLVESHRHRAMIVGENLGTVPAYVNRALSRYGVQRMYVTQFEATADLRRGIPPIPTNTMASLNTHDMPTFAGFWEGLDIAARGELDLLNEADAEGARRSREDVKAAMVSSLVAQGMLNAPATQRTALDGCLAHLGASKARMVLVNLEDLWQETEPQNTPGTSTERPNWRRKARHSLEAMSRMPTVRKSLDELARQRRNERKPS